MNTSTKKTLAEPVAQPCTSLVADALPEVSSSSVTGDLSSGVSTRNVPNESLHWYALRTTYGREKRAYDYIVKHGCQAFYPTISVIKEINGKRKMVEVSRLPNILFAYGTEDNIKQFVYDNVNLPFLRFYYKQYHVGNRVEKIPLIVPDSDIRNLQIICTAKDQDIVILPDEEPKFKKGQKVRIIQGVFSGVEGVVARFKGQQRVGIVIEGLGTVATTYIANSFLSFISES